MEYSQKHLLGESNSQEDESFELNFDQDFGGDDEHNPGMKTEDNLTHGDGTGQFDAFPNSQFVEPFQQQIGNDLLFDSQSFSQDNPLILSQGTVNAIMR